MIRAWVIACNFHCHNLSRKILNSRQSAWPTVKSGKRSKGKANIHNSSLTGSDTATSYFIF